VRTLGPICALLTLAALAGCSGGSKEPVASPSSISPACSTRGYPGVSFLDANGDQLGKPARRDTAEKPHRVTLSPGEKAHVVVGMPQATACEEADSRGIRVYPPGQTDSLHVQWHQTVCTNDEARSSVGPVQPGKTS